MTAVSLSRRQLYELVWSKPMLRVAQEYGISDVGLAKVCRRYDIPRPPRGYWAKLEFGHEPKKTPLPKPENDCPISFNEISESESSRYLAKAGKSETKAEVDEAVVVAESLRGCHELVTKCNQELKVATVDQHKLLAPPENATLNVRTSRSLLHRALLIMDAILKAMEQRGHVVAAGPIIEIEGEPVRFGIRELLQQVREEEEPDFVGSYMFGHSNFRTRQVPSGRLILEIHESSCGLKRSWRDSDKQQVEECLNRFIGVMTKCAMAKLAARAEKERRQLAHAEANRQLEQDAAHRAEKRRLQVQEREKVDQLWQKVNNWSQSQTLRAYIAAVRDRHLANGGCLEPDSEMSRWITWATQQADRLDPLSKSPPSILDERIPDEPKRSLW